MTESPTSDVYVGLMGLGAVGGGVAATLLEHSNIISRTTGHSVKLKKILIRDRDKPRSPIIPTELITFDPEDILADPQIQIVVEVIGGIQPSSHYLKSALNAGKHVVTANKEVMSKHGPELMALAQQGQVNLLFEASVGGGIPIIGCLMNELLANNIRSVRGIINGTTNYILTRMASHGTKFSQALLEAQERGYAEADPTDDVQGRDAVYKLAILATLAFHTRVRPEDIYREGIANLDPQDFRYAYELGYAIKSLAIATLDNGTIQARVHPALVPLGHMLAKVDGAYNAVEVDGSLSGKVLFHGMGAGQQPTTSAVVGDLIEIVRKLGSERKPVPAAQLDSPWNMKSIDDLKSKYYLRLNLTDQPGVLAQITRILGDGNIGIASVLQKDSDPAEQTAEMVIITHPALEASVQMSLKQVSKLKAVRGVNNLVRIAE